MDRIGFFLFIPERPIFCKQVFSTNLWNNNRKIILMNVGVIGIEKEELIKIIRASKNELPPEKERLLKNTLELARKRVLHYLIPLSQFPSISSNSLLKDAIKKAKTHNLLELPVYKGNAKDNIIGVIRLADIIEETKLNREISEFISPIKVVPDKMMVTQLLSDPTLWGLPLLGVIDEYGRIKGFFVWGDFVRFMGRGLLPDKKKIKETKHGFILYGEQDIEVLEEITNHHLPYGYYRTIAGFILESIHRLPHKGEILQISGIKMKVIEADQKQIKKIFILKG